MRLGPTVFIVAFFAALPAWFLSTLEGTVAIDCERLRDARAVECTVHERFAFGTRTRRYTTLGARAEQRVHQGRRGGFSTHQLVLRTPEGEVRTLRVDTGNAAVVRVASALDAAVRSGAPRFHADVGPDAVFFVTVAVLVLFAGAGIFIASRPA